MGFCFVFVFVLFFVFVGMHLWHMEVPRLGVKLELQLPAYTTATQIQATSVTYTTAHRNGGYCNPLIEVRDQTHILVDTSHIHYC